MDIIHLEPEAAVAFLTAAVVKIQAQHGEAIRGIQEQLLGMPIQKELTALRFRLDIAEAGNASLRTRIKTTEDLCKRLGNKATSLCYEMKDIINALFNANPNEHHVSAVKRISWYLKGTINLGLWHPKDSGFDLTAYSDADHAGCHLDRKKLSIKLFVASTNEEIFTSEAWTNSFNIDEPIYSELCHEFYSTYEFDEVCADDELRTRKIIKFRLCRRAFSWTLLEFAKRLGLYNSDEIEEEGFDEYFQARHQNGYVNVAWLIARWMKRKGVGSQKEYDLLALDTHTLKELIDYKGRLIPEAPKPCVLRVAIHRPPRASMHDLYERIGNMEIRQGAIEMMSYRQSYHWDMYARVFENMTGVYSVPLKGAYNPPGYDQHQYD
nr:hypothetical protein [Tanacetum cinerariifolium]